MPVIHSENATHKATLLVAEQTLQSAIAGTPTAAATKSAYVSFYRTARASAITNGLSPVSFSLALRELIGQDT
jgi:hypothetical protein